MDVLQEALPGAIGGLITGLIGAIEGPWVQWAIEKSRDRQKNRRELIKAWRQEIATFDFGERQFGSTVAYSEMRPHLRFDARRDLERQRVSIVGSGARNPHGEKDILLDEVARIEREWKLV